MYCLFKEADLIDDKGEIHLEKLSDHVERFDQETQDILFNMGKRCLRPQGSNSCERAYWFHK